MLNLTTSEDVLSNSTVAATQRIISICFPEQIEIGISGYARGVGKNEREMCIFMDFADCEFCKRALYRDRDCVSRFIKKSTMFESSRKDLETFVRELQN